LHVDGSPGINRVAAGAFPQRGDLIARIRVGYPRDGIAAPVGRLPAGAFIDEV